MTGRNTKPVGLVLAFVAVLALSGCSHAAPLLNDPSLPANIVGYWRVTTFDQHDTSMLTCFGNDAAVAFRADGTWTGYNAADLHQTYDGRYTLRGPATITMVAGITQRYTVTQVDDRLVLRNGSALVIQLQRAPAPPADSASAAWPVTSEAKP